MIDYDYELPEGYTVRPLSNVILVYGMEHGEEVTKSGIIIPDGDNKDFGIKPRKAIVYKVGKKIDYVKSGDIVYVSHGRWSRGFLLKETGKDPIVIRRVDPKDILLSS